MRKSIISVCLAFVMAGSFAACAVAPEDETLKTDADVESGEIELVKSDVKFTQEQALSRIKAEYLKENEGYRDGDRVVAIVTLKENAVIDDYLALENAEESLGDYAAGAGAARAKRAEMLQNALVSELIKNDLITGVENKYTTVMNGVAVSTEYGKLAEIEKIAGVDSVILSDTYNRVQTTAKDAGELTESILNNVDVYETGIFNSSSVSFTGKRTAVAVLDSGFDCSHSVFSRQPEGELLISQQDVSECLPQMNASTTTRGLELTDVWYSKKIPYAYDYADKDYDVFPYDSEHGTHVAGIIGGKDDVITGVAVDTQLVLMKVFPDLNDGAETDDILAALEDAVLLKVDAINMSLGSSCGFSREEDGNKINDVYDKLNESGVSLLTAASNSYSSAFGGEQGNTNKVTNPDSSTVGSPSTYAAALSVASISGVKSSYLIANGSDVVFFNESSSITGKENDFVGELAAAGVLENGSKVLEYVTVPGYGKQINYSGVDVTGKVALVKRGDNTFEDKALQAKLNGAVACIIYNNVEGDISMSMGKTDHIPTVSVTKEVGTMLAAHDTGTLKIDVNSKAGPFMSDFSSWGPSPNLELKPEITAHGGKIKSSVPGGDYDELSGTSMATPNLCGIVVLIRQYLKEKFPAYSHKQIVTLCNQMLMSTATIVLNEEGNPYSPRKQGAGLASLYNVVNTKAYLSVDGKDRSKLELGDDAKKTGEYVMEFNVVNLSAEALSYRLSVVGMTETVSTSDSEYVAEKGQILGGAVKTEVTEGGTLAGDTVSVNANGTAKVRVTYTLTDADKKLIDSLFPNGMFVEGFVKLVPTEENGIDLNIPFLAFYGDWTQAPIFDKTYYEVESEAHDGSIDDEDKLKADYFATTPYGSYFYNYIIPLGAYLYDMDEGYDAIPATEEHIAVSDQFACIDGFSAVYGGLLRNAKTMTYTITDKVTGEVVHEFVDYNANKAYSMGATPIPYFEYINWKSKNFNFVNNRSYEFKLAALLDYGEDGGKYTNKRNTFSFDFTFDNEAPVIKQATYEKVYDRTLKKDRFYVNLTVYDNHYVQAITPIVFNSSSSYTVLTDNPIPVYSERGKDNKVRIEITDFLDDMYSDNLITSSLAFMVEDYALNSNLYLCQLPGTRGEFKFTRNGEIDGSALTILSIYEDEVVDLTQYLATADKSVDADKDYLNHLVWTSSNEKVAEVERGQVRGVSAGRSTVSVTEQMDLKKATLLINVKKRETAEPTNANAGGGRTVAPLSADNVDHASDAKLESLRFDYFETKFAYARAAQRSEIGSTGSRIFLSSLGSRVSMYPGESIQLHYDLQPWYAEGNYEGKLHFATSDSEIATVSDDGLVFAKKKGAATITLRVDGSNIMARLSLTVNSEFIIENRTLIAYKGLGGVVTIPDDEGILYVGSFAFCLYETDTTVELPEDDLDANKVPDTNTTITKVIIPEGVEDVQKYAFYNCPGLEEVVLPSSVKFLREYTFYNDVKLSRINLEKVQVIGAFAFHGCESLDGISPVKTYAIGRNAFQGCTSLSSIDLSALRNTGESAFQGCTALESVTLNENTKLSQGMFARSGLKTLDLYERIEIPRFCFAQCEELTTVTLHNDVVTIGYGAFCQNDLLASVTTKGVGTIGEQAFYDCGSLEEFTLPNGSVNLGNYAFMDCDKLATVKLGAGTQLNEITGSVFRGTALSRFEVAEGGQYKTGEDGKFLLDSSGETVLFAVLVGLPEKLTIGAQYKKIGASAFGGAKIKTLTFESSETEIGDYAFANCEELTSVVFPAGAIAKIGKHAFNNTTALQSVDLSGTTKVGDYAFANSGVKDAVLGANAEFGEGAFFQSSLETVSIGANSDFGLGAFQNCKSLVTVNMPADGGVHFGEACFSGDTVLTTLDFTKVGEKIERESFYGCTSLTGFNGKIDLANVTEVGDFAFADCGSIGAILIPKVVKLGEGAFARYAKSGAAPAIQSVSLPETLKEIGDGVFMGCEQLLSVTIPASLEKCGNYFFAYCINLQMVVLPASLTQIGDYWFYGCESINIINLSNVEKIGDYAFTSAVELRDIDLSSLKEVGFGAFASSSVTGDITANNLVNIGDYAFQGTDITSFSASALREIGIAAFQNNRNLEKFVFSDDLESVGIIAFNGCAKLKSFYLTKDGGESADGEIGTYARLEDGLLYTKLPNGEWELNSVPAAYAEETLTVAEGTVSVAFYAGNANENVTAIVLPDSLKAIGGYAFYGYKNLKSVQFNSFTAPALQSTYEEDAELTEKDPGYELLHNQFGLFGYELWYFNFIDMVGKKEPITMILPANADIQGYDSVVYQAYFGTVEKAERSDYVAKDANLSDFLDYAKQIGKIEKVTIADEKLIDNAIVALNAVKQDATDYGYTADEWNGMVETVKAAKKTLDELRGVDTKDPVKPDPPEPEPEPKPEPEPEPEPEKGCRGEVGIVGIAVGASVMIAVAAGIVMRKRKGGNR